MIDVEFMSTSISILRGVSAGSAIRDQPVLAAPKLVKSYSYLGRSPVLVLLLESIRNIDEQRAKPPKGTTNGAQGGHCRRSRRARSIPATKWRHVVATRREPVVPDSAGEESPNGTT